MSTRRSTLAALCAALLAGAAPAASAAEEKVLNIANWAEYIGDDTVHRFEQETGIQVRYDLFDSNEVLLAKMIAGRTGYDIVVPSSDFAHMMLEGGVIRKLDRSKLTHWDNLSPPVMALMARLDPGNQYMVPWLGSTVSVGYNLDKVKAALGAETTRNQSVATDRSWPHGDVGTKPLTNRISSIAHCRLGSRLRRSWDTALAHSGDRRARILVGCCTPPLLLRSCLLRYARAGQRSSTTAPRYRSWVAPHPSRSR